MIRAVLFDFDGVLVDSMPYHVRNWQEVFRPYGVKIEPRDVLLLEGRPGIEIAAGLAEKAGLQLKSEELHRITKRKRKLYQATTRAKLLPEARDLLTKLKQQGFKVGLVTGSVLGNIKAVLDEEALRLFDVIVTSEEVANGKPHPESYLRAAEKLNCQPSQCLVVENAPIGIQAAKAASMTCIAVTSTLNPEELQEADRIVGRLAEIDLAQLR